MEDDNIVVSLCIIIIASASASAILRKSRDRRRPRVWARSWIRRHARYGAHHSLIKELSSEDPKGFKNFIRMDTNDFEEFEHFYTFNFTTGKDVMNGNCVALLLLFFFFFGKTLTSVTYKLIG